MLNTHYYIDIFLLHFSALIQLRCVTACSLLSLIRNAEDPFYLLFLITRQLPNTQTLGVTVTVLTTALNWCVSLWYHTFTTLDLLRCQKEAHFKLKLPCTWCKFWNSYFNIVLWFVAVSANWGFILWILCCRRSRKMCSATWIHGLGKKCFKQWFRTKVVSPRVCQRHVWSAWNMTKEDAHQPNKTLKSRCCGIHTEASSTMGQKSRSACLSRF